MSQSELVSVITIALMLGKSQAHTQHVVSAAKYNFPPPVARGRNACLLYRRAEVEVWQQWQTLGRNLDNSMAQAFIRGEIGGRPVVQSLGHAL